MPNPHLIVDPVPSGSGGSLRVSGELDMVTAGVLRDAISSLAAEHDGSVVLDVAGVTFIDSSGINALVGARHGLTARGHALELRGMSPNVRRVLEVAGVVSHFSPEVAAAD